VAGTPIGLAAMYKGEKAPSLGEEERKSKEEKICPNFEP